VDSHELIALCAPRPVFIGAGATQVMGGWMPRHVSGSGRRRPVYKLLGKKDLGTTEFPAIETPLIDGDIAFRQHKQRPHSAPNWPVFLTFARRYLKGPAAVAGARLLER